LINVSALAVLLMYTQTLGYLARVAAQPTLSSDDLGALCTPSVALHSVLALLLLLVATVLAVYKPRGMTQYGMRKQRARRPAPAR
jgi:membrane-anchored glycerophosphoryl diester phosphodiesterase (GDPDase)